MKKTRFLAKLYIFLYIPETNNINGQEIKCTSVFSLNRLIYYYVYWINMG